ncbi:MAG TPA: hypothetical protein VK324_16055, partial [Tepidisphaeraceae bacterium]|nr:hypothetical protein [Tepidisphaeraceae bacterium]
AAAGFGGDGEGVADRFTAAAGDAAWQPFMPRGYRLHVVTNRGPGPVQVRVTAARTHADVGDARPCPVDDPLLTRVWRTSATTLLAGMLDAFVDNNSREQAQWLGDLAVSGPAAFATFGDASLWRRGLRLAAQSQQPDGALNSIPPSEANFMCVADYSFHWLSSLWALYEATRDRDLLIELLPAAAKLLHDFVTPNLTADRLFVTPQGRWQFLDWSLLDHRPYSLTLNLVLLRALEAGVRVSAACGNADLAARFAESAHDLREAAERRFWSNEHDAWLDHVDPSPAVTSAFAKRLERHDRSPWMQRPPPGGSYFPCTVHSNALAASLKLGTPQQQAAALAFVRRAVTSPGQTFTNTHGPLWTAWVLLPLLEGGHRDDVIAAIRATYGKWLDQGATTWGEGNDASAQTHAQTWGACVNLVIARLAETV